MAEASSPDAAQRHKTGSSPDDLLVFVRSIDPRRQLDHAMEDAQILLSFAIQSRRSPKSELVAELNTAIDDIEASQREGKAPMASQRTAFWKAFDELVGVVSPVNAFTIKATNQMHQLRWFRMWRSPTFVHAMIALTVFLVTVALQAFWVTGRELLDDAAKLSKRKAEIAELLGRLSDENDRLKADLRMQLCRLAQEEDLRTPANSTQAIRRPVARAVAPLPPDANVCDASAEAQRKMLSRLQPLQASLDQADRQLRTAARDQQTVSAGMQDLQPALSAWYRLCFICTDIDKAPIALRLSIVAAKLQDCDGKAWTRATTLWQASDDLEWQRCTQIKNETINLEAAKERDFVQRARMLLAGLERYAIPMLMGVLGALTFMLRSMVTQLRDYTYMPIFPSISLIRMCLGGIAGVFGAFFLAAEEPGIRALPPVIIPFVLGYGIEIVFAALDRFVRSFTSDSKQAF